MNTFGLYAFLTCLFFAGSCFSLELNNLCKEDHFTYNDVLVNSVRLVINNERSLGNVSRYAIISIDNCEESDKYDNYDSFIRNWAADIKKKYNLLIVRVYSERYLNDKNLNDTKIGAEMKQVDEWLGKAKSFLRNYLRPNTGLYQCIEKNFVNKIKEGWNYRFVDPEKHQYLKMVQGDIKVMEKDIEDGQTMAFMDEFETEVFRKPLVTRPKFKFVKKSKIVYDFDSYVLADFKVAYPFNVANFDSSQPCLKASELTPFFVKKGKI